MSDEKLRLHVTPLSEDLAQSILSAHSNLTAESISYHTLETFPEKSYGYVDLPPMEAEKLKRRLNGSILKGKKLRVENARPQKRGLSPESDGENASSLKQEVRRNKKSKAGEQELKGHELSPERRIKRGWTEPGNGKQHNSSNREKSPPVGSKYTDKQECLFRVQLPPNKETDGSGLSRIERDRATKRKKRGKVVHEFEKSVMQPTFLREEPGTGKAGVAAEYVDGQGWVDRDGNTIEQVNERQLRSRRRRDEPHGEHGLPKFTPSSAARGPTGQSRGSNGRKKHNGDQAEDASAATSGEGTNSESGSESDDGLDTDPETNQAGTQNHEIVENSSKKGPTDNSAVHPLEALFKRPKQAASQSNGKRPLEIKTTFNFFDPDDEQGVPQTPFTTRDLQLRGLRSAAPTPDTALPTRRFFAESASPPSSVGVDDGVESEELSHGAGPSKESKKGDGESEFAAWFWEHRGDNNRAWKRRRREAMKEKRQREKRQKGRRIG
jgi:hypothetical protein